MALEAAQHQAPVLNCWRVSHATLLHVGNAYMRMSLGKLKCWLPVVLVLCLQRKPVTELKGTTVITHHFEAVLEVSTLLNSSRHAHVEVALVLPH